jgi:hypothetical protein
VPVNAALVEARIVPWGQAWDLENVDYVASRKVTNVKKVDAASKKVTHDDLCAGTKEQKVVKA